MPRNRNILNGLMPGSEASRIAASRRSQDPESYYLPHEYDFGNVRAISYGIDSGLSAENLANFLTQLNATTTEINAVIKIYSDWYGMQTHADQILRIKKAFEIFSHNNKVDTHKEACAKCKKEIIYWNLISTKVKLSWEDKVDVVNICGGCLDKLSLHKAQCNKHRGVMFLEKRRAECPLYPTKCFPKNFCNLPECLHNHMEQTHNGYVERRWRKSKRFLSKTKGAIIKSDLMTGIEYEVIGKNNETTRANIFKLGKSIGLDQDHSIQQFRLNTELVTPPASGIKLEDMVYRTANALQKDGFMVNSKCGLHIHIDLFTKYGHINSNPDFYKSLLAAYVIFENAFYRIVPKSRSRNPNIRELEERYIGLLSNKKSMEQLRFSKIWYRNDDDNEVMRMRGMKRHDTKYCWANFHSLLRKEGLEIRLMEGSIDAKVILQWIRLNHAFIDAVSKQPNFFREFSPKYRAHRALSAHSQISALAQFIGADEEMSIFIMERFSQHQRSTQDSTNLADDSLHVVFDQLRTNPQPRRIIPPQTVPQFATDTNNLIRLGVDMLAANNGYGTGRNNTPNGILPTDLTILPPSRQYEFRVERRIIDENDLLT